MLFVVEQLWRLTKHRDWTCRLFLMSCYYKLISNAATAFAGALGGQGVH
jgi:hypothetical protein